MDKDRYKQLCNQLFRSGEGRIWLDASIEAETKKLVAESGPEIHKEHAVFFNGRVSFLNNIKKIVEEKGHTNGD